jgi:hypothetical protein
VAERDGILKSLARRAKVCLFKELSFLWHFFLFKEKKEATCPCMLFDCSPLIDNFFGETNDAPAFEWLKMYWYQRRKFSQKISVLSYYYIFFLHLSV